MFIIASTGRCGTKAICEGLARFSDHEVRHEPPPTLLVEAWLKHQGRPYLTETLTARLDELRSRGDKYGESFRAPNLLCDVRQALPNARIMVVVRGPLEYIASAHFRRVLRKGDEWDARRLMPQDLPEEMGLAERIAWHWRTCNEYLLAFAEQDHNTVVVLHQAWEGLIGRLPAWLGIRIENPGELTAFWGGRPNASLTKELPDDYDAARIAAICDPAWYRARGMAVA